MQPTFVKVKGRPPSSPPSIFHGASKLYASKQLCGTETTISAYTSTVQGTANTTSFTGLQPVLVIRLKTGNDTPEDDENDDALCPWVTDSPYSMSLLGDLHVRIDAEENPAFWCECPVALLPSRDGVQP